MAHLTIERLREVLEYHPKTGMWFWRIKVSDKVMPGMMAGAIDGQGYRLIGIDKTRYRAGRLAFFYMTARWPHPEIDHINRHPADDRWENLREVTPRQNILNRGMNRNNTSGLKGIRWQQSGRKWVARTKVNYRYVHIGSFETKEEAHQAYLDYLKHDIQGDE